MDILCSDKTGTLTQNRLTMGEPYVVGGGSSEEVLRCAVHGELVCETGHWFPLLRFFALRVKLRKPQLVLREPHVTMNNTSRAGRPDSTSPPDVP